MSPYSKSTPDTPERLSNASDATINNTTGATQSLPKMLDFGSWSPFEHLYGKLPSTPNERVLYISRHGESLYNLENRIGGNPSLSPQGFKYARALGSHVNNWAIPDLKVSLKQSLTRYVTLSTLNAVSRSGRAN